MRDNILATLAYYDVLDKPLTIEEIDRYLVRFSHLGLDDSIKYQEKDIQNELDLLEKENIVKKKNNLYFLFDKEYLVPLRNRREEMAEKKFLITRRAVKWLVKLPFVKSIFASGSLAMNNTSELSDLDVLIITKNGRIWTARFLVLLMLSFLGVRRNHNHKIAPDLVCANHFITDDSLEIPFRSLYTGQLYANLIPLFGEDKLIIDFKESNTWLLNYVYNWDTDMSNVIQNKKNISILEKMLSSSLGEYIEKKLRTYQTKRISNGINSKLNGRIIQNDKQLEFHPQSPEARIIPKYNNRLMKIGLGHLAIESDSGLN